MKIHILTLIFASFIISSCSENNNCSGFPADSIQKIRSVSILDKNYHVYLRASGFHEKEHFYEIYDHIPNFDSCGISDSFPVSDDHVNTNNGHVSKLVMHDDKLEIIYTQDESNKVDYDKIEVNFKQNTRK